MDDRTMENEPNDHRERRHVSLTLPCQKCQSVTFLVRGLCESCAPTRHMNYRRAAVTASMMMVRFEMAAGQSALNDWPAFQSFVQQQPDASEYAAILAMDSKD
jgi:hypothetical protein